MTNPTDTASNDPQRAAGEVWPVCSGSSFDLWEPDTGDYYDSVRAESIQQHLHAKRLSQRETASSAFSELPEEVTDDPDTLPCLRPRVAFRDVTRANDSRTFRCALIPPDRVLTHQAPYLLQTQGSPVDEAYVLGVLSSMIFDWQTRQTTELHMTFEQLNQASVPDPGEGHPLRDRVTEIAGRLAAADGRFDAWAKQIGAEAGTVGDGEREDMLAQLDACVAVLYGLDPDDVTVLYDTFGLPGQWNDRRDAVLSTMRQLSEGSQDD